MIGAIIAGLSAGAIHVLAGPDHLAAVAPLAHAVATPVDVTDTVATTWMDPDTPASGEAFVYWVQGVSPVCGPGSLGYDSEGRDRGAPLCQPRADARGSTYR